MNASQAAEKVRQAIKKAGFKPKGMVRVINNDYVTEIEVDLRGIYGESRILIEEAIRAIEYNPNYSWNVN